MSFMTPPSPPPISPMIQPLLASAPPPPPMFGQQKKPGSKPAGQKSFQTSFLGTDTAPTTGQLGQKTLLGA